MNIAANDPLNPKKMNLKSTLPNLISIWIYGNPLRCNCHLKALIEATQPPAKCKTTAFGSKSKCNEPSKPTTPIVIDPSTYTRNNITVVVRHQNTKRAYCQSDDADKAVDIRWVNLEELKCETGAVTIFVSIVLGPLAFAAAILVAFVCG